MIRYCPICEKDVSCASISLEGRRYYVCENGHKHMANDIDKEEEYEEKRKIKKHKKSNICDKCGKVMVHNNKNISCVECECGHIEFVDGLNGYVRGMGEELRMGKIYE